MKVFTLFLFLFPINLSPIGAQQADSTEEKVVYKYKEYEKFDFDSLSVKGDAGAPGDLSIIPRSTTQFTNKLPLRENFNPEIRKSIERVQ